MQCIEIQLSCGTPRIEVVVLLIQESDSNQNNADTQGQKACFGSGIAVDLLQVCSLIEWQLSVEIDVGHKMVTGFLVNKPSIHDTNVQKMNY